jgi:peptidoglycan/LPS O-acetylase OafA/YrhL
VLSGFLITGILLRERKAIDSAQVSVRQSVMCFYARRSLRIAPLYYVCIFSMLVIGGFTHNHQSLWFILYASNVMYWIQGHFGGPLSHFWTLAVEEQFYLVWPMILFLVPIRKLHFLFMSLVACGAAWRAVMALTVEASFVATSTLVFGNVDAFGLGALLALRPLLSEDRASTFNRRLSVLTPVAVAIMCVSRLYPTEMLTLVVDQSAVAIAATWLVAKAANGFDGVAGRFLENAVVLYLGKISYGLYVFHMVAPRGVAKLCSYLNLPPALSVGGWGIVSSTALTIMVASISWYVLESPINRLKRLVPYPTK